MNNGSRGRGAPVYIQSFEVANPQLRGTTKPQLVQLINCEGKPWDFVQSNDPRTYTDLFTPAGLDFIGTYA